MSGSIVGKLRVMLGLDTSGFKQGAKGVGPQIAQMRNQFLAVAGIATALGASLGTMALRGARAIDDTAKAARRLDASVAGYRALEMAADDAGVSLSSLANDVQTMNREISKNSKAAQAALEQLGLTAGDLEGLDVDQKMALIADRIKQLGLDSAQTSALLQGLGVRNREMALLMVQGGDALRAARGDVEEFGLALSDVDAAAIERATDQIAGLGDISTYVADQLALRMVPAMGALAESITESLREGGLLRTVLDNLDIGFQALAVTLSGLAASSLTAYVVGLARATTATGLLTTATNVARGALIFLGGPLGLVAGLLGAGAAAFLLLRDNSQEGAAAMGDAQKAASVLGTELAILAGNDLPATSKATVQLANDNLSLARSAYAAAEAQMALKQANLQAAFDQSSMENAFLPGMLDNPGNAIFQKRMKEAKDAATDLRKAEEELNKRVFEGNQIKRATAEELRNITVTVDRTSASLDGLGSGGAGAAKTLKNELDGVAEAAAAAEQAHQQWAQNAAGHFDGLITGGKNLSGVLSSIARQLESKVWQQLFGGMGGGSGGGGGLGGIFKGLLGGFSGGVKVPTSVLSAIAPSFDGGGYTGSGPRSGGLDGKGGFLAKLHPQETVIDHTRGQGAMLGGGVSVVEIALGEGLVGSILKQAGTQTVRIVQSETPKMIGGAMKSAYEQGTL